MLAQSRFPSNDFDAASILTHFVAAWPIAPGFSRNRVSRIQVPLEEIHFQPGGNPRHEITSDAIMEHVLARQAELQATFIRQRSGQRLLMIRKQLDDATDIIILLMPDLAEIDVDERILPHNFYFHVFMIVKHKRFPREPQTAVKLALPVPFGPASTHQSTHVFSKAESSARVLVVKVLKSAARQARQERLWQALISNVGPFRPADLDEREFHELLGDVKRQSLEAIDPQLTDLFLIPARFWKYITDKLAQESTTRFIEVTSAGKPQSGPKKSLFSPSPETEEQKDIKAMHMHFVVLHPRVKTVAVHLWCSPLPGDRARISAEVLERAPGIVLGHDAHAARTDLVRKIVHRVCVQAWLWVNN